MEIPGSCFFVSNYEFWVQGSKVLVKLGKRLLNLDFGLLFFFFIVSVFGVEDQRERAVPCSFTV